MAGSKKAVLLINTHSRKGKDLLVHAEKSLRDHGVEVTRTHALEDSRQIGEAVERIVQERTELLIVGSGDGTISEVVDHLAYTNTILGYVPLGTSNNFARSLGIPLEFDGAIDVIANGKVAQIDLGKIGEDFYANVASIGLTVDVAQGVSSTWKRWVGRLAYAATGLNALFRHRSFSTTISANSEQYEYDTHQIIIANGRFHAGTLIARDASIDNHSLIIFHLGDNRRIQLLRSLLLFTLKRQRTLREGNFIVTAEANITTSPPRRVELDGEIKATTPIVASVAPGALKVMVSQEFDDD